MEHQRHLEEVNNGPPMPEEALPSLGQENSVAIDGLVSEEESEGSDEHDELPTTLSMVEQAEPGEPEDQGQGQAEPDPYSVKGESYQWQDIFKNKIRWLDVAIGLVQGHVEYMYGVPDDQFEDWMSDSGLGGMITELEGERGEVVEEMEEWGQTSLVKHRGFGMLKGGARGKVLDWSKILEILPKDYADKLTTRLFRLLGKKWGIVRGMLKDGFIKSLNSQDWQPIIKQLTFDNGNTYTSEFTPVNEYFDEENFGEYGTSGNSSMSPRLSPTKKDPDKELEDRTTNLWLSQYKSENGKMLFESFRSGTLCYTFTDLPEERRKEIAKNKTYDLLCAVVIDHITKKVPEDRLEGVLGGYDPIHIDFGSINLQTPGNVGFLGAEERHVDDEHEALTSFQGNNVFSLMFGGVLRDIKVDLNIIALDFGVNSARNMRVIDPFMDKRQKRINKDDDHGIPALERLVEEFRVTSDTTLGSVQEALDGLDDDDPEYGPKSKELEEGQSTRTKVDELWEQIEKHWKSGGTLYEIPARISNLMFLMGKAVHFNCKSGKDRTGFMDVESKFLAQQMEETGHAPEYENKLHGEEKDTHRKLVFESGNLEVQEMNTGAKGYKIAPMAIAETAMWERLGKKLSMAQGLGDLTVVEAKYEDKKKL